MFCLFRHLFGKSLHWTFIENKNQNREKIKAEEAIIQP